VREQRLARGQERHPTRRAREEVGAELLFERANVSRERRLRDAQPTCGAGDVLLFGHGHEVAELIEAHGVEIPRRRAPPPYREGIGPHDLDARRVSAVIEILTASEQARMRRAGRVAAETLRHVATHLRIGMTTADIDRLVRDDTARRGGRPSQLGYKGFPAAVCTSRNEVVCHGIPRREVVLREGDIVNVDVTTELDGFHGDTSETFTLGEVSESARRVVDVARRCRDAGVAVVRQGARMGDLGAAIEELARREGCGIVDEFGGHGIGRRMHQDPHVAHTGTRGAGARLLAGMALTIEPMITLGRPGIRVLDDGWTVVTRDGSPSAQFEHTVLVTRDGCEVLTHLTEGSCVAERDRT
jgi:methionyl aminopeptidase